MDKFRKVQLNELKSVLTFKIDLFICSSSFDERCLILINTLDLDLVERIRICHFENNYIVSENNLDKMKAISPEKVETLILKKHNPIAVYDMFYSLLSSIPSDSTIIVDTTTLTRENLLILSRILFDKFQNIQSYFLYTPSSAYYEQNMKPEDIWLSKGIRDIRTVLGYSGDFSAMKELLLIVLVGFEYERAETLIEIFEPSKLYIGQAFDSTSINSELAKINDCHFQKLKMTNPHCIPFSFSCIDIETTKESLEDIIVENREKYNIVISPMSNKISTISCAITALTHPDIQVCYASTNQYNIDIAYSPCDYVYLLKLNNYY
ncbi:hypothetical protein ACTMKN_12895 [Bacteroides pyogenes]|uniref:hypothetical protein n=1 Tax=Bacteroides pyogenes TaxID=310300 RepID=UPI0011E4B087|nr:hypothetical protein [Bacteroides pyogenes]TYK38582.1 hypothetical protein FNJ59_08275 [Bacteroides pyogenes]